MEYNYKEIGRIITKERKKTGLSQDAFIQLIREKHGYSISRNTLSKIENGNTSHYDCELLYILCDIFDCEMGYLLGEYGCKTGRSTDISKATGLSEPAIEKLQRFTNPIQRDYKQLENDLHSTGGYTKQEITAIIKQEKERDTTSIVHEYPNIISRLIEHQDTVKALSLIARKAKSIRSVKNNNSIYAIGGRLEKIDEDEVLEYLIQSRISSIIRDIVNTYQENHK